MATNENALTTLSPEAAEQIEALSDSIQQRLEIAWTALHSEDGAGVEEASNQLVAIDQERRQLQQFGQVAVATLVGMTEAIQTVTEQRDMAVNQRDDAREELLDLQDNFEQTVFEAVNDAMVEADPEDFFDMDQLVSDAEDAWIVDIELKVRWLRAEGNEAGAAELEDAMGAYIEARQTLMDESNVAQTKLIAFSNARRAAEGIPPAGYYMAVRNVVTPQDSADDEDEDDDLDFEDEESADDAA